MCAFDDCSANAGMITRTAVATQARADAPRIAAARRRSGWRNQQPHRERGDQQAHLLLAEHGEGGADAERHPAGLLGGPDAEEQQRGGERHRVEVEEGGVLHGRVEQVGRGARERQPVVAQPAAPEPEGGQRAGRDDHGLRDQQHLGARPDPPQRREEHQHRVDVGAEARELAAGDVGRLEEAPLGRAPDRLHHVAEVEAAGGEAAVAEHRQPGEDRGVGRRHQPDGERGPVGQRGPQPEGGGSAERRGRSPGATGVLPRLDLDAGSCGHSPPRRAHAGPSTRRAAL